MHESKPQTTCYLSLSNPTSSCEAIPQDLMDWTRGQAIVATGSPFPDITIDGQSFPVGQGNNAFIFPGLGFAAILGRCSRISDAMVLESAYALAEFKWRPGCSIKQWKMARHLARIYKIRISSNMCVHDSGSRNIYLIAMWRACLSKCSINFILMEH